MSKSLKVIYENDVLRPLEPVPFHEHQQMTVKVFDHENTTSENKSESCYDIAQRSGIIGIVEEASSDLSTNPQYFEGFGRNIETNTR